MEVYDLRFFARLDVFFVPLDEPVRTVPVPYANSQPFSDYTPPTSALEARDLRWSQSYPANS
jgi:hypothetical protein